MLGYIYRTVNRVNGKIYIGQHHSEVFEESYKGSGTYLWRAINKHGWDNFSVELLCPCFSQEELDDEERFLIDYFNSRSHSIGYNISEGGTGGDVSQGMTPADYKTWCTNISRSLLGKSKTPEQVAKVAYKLKGKPSPLRGRPLADTTKQKMRANHADVSGKNNPMYGIRRLGSDNPMYGVSRCGSDNPFYNKHHSDETKQAIGGSKKGRISITNGDINKFIYPDEYPFYESLGYRKGQTRR